MFDDKRSPKQGSFLDIENGFFTPNSFEMFFNAKGPLTRAPAKMGTTVAVVFHNLLSSIWRPSYFWISSVCFALILQSAGMATSMMVVYLSILSISTMSGHR